MDNNIPCILLINIKINYTSTLIQNDISLSRVLFLNVEDMVTFIGLSLQKTIIGKIRRQSNPLLTQLSQEETNSKCLICGGTLEAKDNIYY